MARLAGALSLWLGVAFGLSALPEACASAPGLAVELHAPATVVAGSPITLHWVLRNQGGSPLRVASHVIAGPRPQFDELTLRVCLAGTSNCREVIFQTARAASAPVQCVLLPGHALVQAIDLSAWLVGPGAPLQPGRYDLQAIYQRPAAGPGAIDDAPPPALCGSTDGASPASSQPVRAPLWTGTVKSAITPLAVAAVASR